MYVLRALIADFFYPTGPIDDLSRHRSIVQRIGHELRVQAHNLRHRPDASDVLILSAGVGLVHRSGGSFNRISDDLAAFLGDRAWTVDSVLVEEWPALNRTNERLSMTGDRRLTGSLDLRGPVRRSHRSIIEELVGLAAERGRDLLGWSIGAERRELLVGLGSRRLAAYPAQARWARRIIGRVKPRTVLAREGCYDRMAVFNVFARDLGVRVAEFQHGMITKNHDAYNVAPVLAASEPYALTKPDSFLAFGSWWNSQFNAPVGDRQVLGSPTRSNALSSWQPAESRTNVVVLGDGIETDATLEFCREAAKVLSSPWRVVFRPHPLERQRVSSEPGLILDGEADIYASLASAHAVVGESSTVLYEAIDLVPRVFAWDTRKSRFNLGDHPFERVLDGAELGQLMVDREARTCDDGLGQSVWANDWQSRLRAYVDAQSVRPIP